MTIEKFLIQAGLSLLSNPDALEQIFCRHHTPLEAAQDVLDAAESGKLSIPAARRAVEAILSDLEAKSQPTRSARPQERSLTGLSASDTQFLRDIREKIAQGLY